MKCKWNNRSRKAPTNSHSTTYHYPSLKCSYHIDHASTVQKQLEQSIRGSQPQSTLKTNESPGQTSHHACEENVPPQWLADCSLPWETFRTTYKKAPHFWKGQHHSKKLKVLKWFQCNREAYSPLLRSWSSAASLDCSWWTPNTVAVVASS